MIEVPKPVIEEESRTIGDLAPLYRVLVHNDDLTPFPFVMGVLIQVFKLSRDRATAVTLEAHERDVALVIVEPREHAEFHIEQAHSLARGRKCPLTFTMEPA